MNIEQLIDKELKKEQDTPREHSGKFKPSLFGRCYRLQVFARKNEEQTNPPDARTLRVFKVGHIIHEFIQQYVPKESVEVLIEEDDVKGYADIVTKKTVIDIKSCHSRAFWYMGRAGYDVAKEKFTNWLQVMYYALRLEKPKGKLVFVSKDDLCINEYTQEAQEWEQAVENELTKLRAFWGAGELPPAEPRAYGGKECKYCSYSLLCKRLQEEG